MEGGSAFGERVRLINSKAELYVLFCSQQSFVRMGGDRGCLSRSSLGRVTVSSNGIKFCLLKLNF